MKFTLLYTVVFIALLWIWASTRISPPDVKPLIALAKQGDVKAQFALGVLYVEGTPKSLEQGAHYYELAANQGYAVAEYNLAEMYYNGYGVDKDKEKAIKYYKLAADHGYVLAQEWMGMEYDIGYLVPVNYELAEKYFKLAADQGSAQAQYFLGEFYENGRGGHFDLEKVIKYYTLAAEQDQMYSTHKLGIVRSILARISRARQGDLQEQIALGNYFRGVLNFEQAINYYQLAIGQGSLEATYSLGVMYLGDELGREYYSKGFDLIKKAARGGYKDAQRYLRSHDMDWNK